MRRSKAHLLVFAAAIVFGMVAYGFVHAGLAVQRWLDPDSLRATPPTNAPNRP